MRDAALSLTLLCACTAQATTGAKQKHTGNSIELSGASAALRGEWLSWHASATAAQKHTLRSRCRLTHCSNSAPFVNSDMHASLNELRSALMQYRDEDGSWQDPGMVGWTVRTPPAATHFPNGMQHETEASCDACTRVFYSAASNLQCMPEALGMLQQALDASSTYAEQWRAILATADALSGCRTESTQTTDFEGLLPAFMLRPRVGEAAHFSPAQWIVRAVSPVIHIGVPTQPSYADGALRTQAAYAGHDFGHSTGFRSAEHLHTNWMMLPSRQGGIDYKRPIDTQHWRNKIRVNAKRQKARVLERIATWTQALRDAEIPICDEGKANTHGLTELLHEATARTLWLFAPYVDQLATARRLIDKFYEARRYGVAGAGMAARALWVHTKPSGKWSIDIVFPTADDGAHQAPEPACVTQEEAKELRELLSRSTL